MPEIRDISHSALIVSASEKFTLLVRNALSGFIAIDIRKSVSLARRCILERYYDLVVVNSPLPDETGEDFVIDVTEKCNASVLFVVPQDSFEDVFNHVTERGVLVAPKPAPRGRLEQAIKFLQGFQNRINKLQAKAEAASERLEEMKLLTQAKFRLMEKKGMTENEAHQAIGKQAMDNCISKRRAAELILDELEG